MSESGAGDSDVKRQVLLPGELTLRTASETWRTLQAELPLCRAEVGASVRVILSGSDPCDGAGAALVARFCAEAESLGALVEVDACERPGAQALVELYRSRADVASASGEQRPGPLARLGAVAAAVPGLVRGAANFVGEFTYAVLQTLRRPAAMDWGSLSRLFEKVGADALLVAGAANLLVGLIIGALGADQLGRFGAQSFIAELVVVSHLRELGPLVTAIIVAGRSGAGFASELGTMKVSEEVDALRVMGINPTSWLVLPRCLVLMICVPLLVWIGDALALFGGALATIFLTDMVWEAYWKGVAASLTLANLLVGLAKAPFLGLAIGMVACGQGLATRGGASAVGERTTQAVVLSMLTVIFISTLFTIAFTMAGF